MKQRLSAFVAIGIIFMLFLQFTMIMVVLNNGNSSTLDRENRVLHGRDSHHLSLQFSRNSQIPNTSLILNDNIKLQRTSKTKETSTSKSKEVDMENDYFPFVDFRFVWPEVKPQLAENSSRSYFIIALVNSAAHGEKYRLRRDGIRKTWANPKFCENLKAKRKWLVLFSLGKVYDALEDAAILKEAQEYNDLLVGDFKDFYLNNVIKTFMGQLWAHSMNPQYILKSDDDVYIRLPSVIDWLVSKESPKRYYGGAPYYNFNVDRDPKGKWAVSKPYFNESKFPPFCAGAFNVISYDILHSLFNYVHRRRPFHTDDAYFGIAARDLGIDVVRIDGLLLEDNMPSGLPGFDNCRLQRARGFGHSLEPNLMQMLYGKYSSMCEKPVQC